MDKAYALGISRGNGWQRLFENTRLQHIFDGKAGYEAVFTSSEDGSDFDMQEREKEDSDSDLERGWVDDLGFTWKSKDPVNDGERSRMREV